MDCTICGKSALPGAMLCAPCKAALKRARYVTVQEDIRRTSVIDVRRQPRRARTSAPKPEQAPITPVPIAGRRQSLEGRRRFFGVVVIAVVVGGAGYWGLRELSARPHIDAAGTTASDAEVRQLPAAGDVASRNNESAAAPLPPALIPTGAAAQAEAAPPAAVAKPPAAPVVKRTVMASRSTFATVNGDPPEAVAPPPEPVKIAAVAPPPPRPVPDPWQNMRDALASCDREGGLGGFICGQKVRVQYCDGYWGKVPQCPGSITTYDR
jgi:hypothetical protein